MKKNFLSVVALILAIAASSFTIIKERSDQVMYSFQYAGPLPATIASVENENNYNYIGNNQAACPGAQQEACRVNVSAAHVDGTALKTSANIQAQLTGTDAEIISVSGGTYSNKPE